MDRRLNLVMVSETYPPEVNGVARTIAIIVEGLRARGHDVKLVRPRQGPTDRALNETGFHEMLRPGVQSDLAGGRRKRDQSELGEAARPP